MKLRKGMLLMVTLKDHVKDADVPPVCVAYGRLHEANKEFIIIDCWHDADPAAPRDSDTERFTIVRSACVDIRELAAKDR